MKKQTKKIIKTLIVSVSDLFCVLGNTRMVLLIILLLILHHISNIPINNGIKILTVILVIGNLLAYIREISEYNNDRQQKS